MTVCRHAGVMTVRLPHYLIDDEIRVSMDVEPLNPKFGGNAQSIDEVLVLYHITGGTEVQSYNVKESISFR
jgi:hypothetical protein